MSSSDRALITTQVTTWLIIGHHTSDDTCSRARAAQPVSNKQGEVAGLI